MNKNRKSLLILDDDEAVRESFEYHFEDRGWKVKSFSNPQEALKSIEEEPPECAVIDIRLPEMNGDEFIREIYRRNINLICVICTASPEYSIPDDISSFKGVSNKVFIKPVIDFNLLEEELLYILKQNFNSGELNE